MAFLDKETRSADAIATDELELFLISREEFDEVASRYPEVSGVFYEKLAYQIAQRLRLNVIELKALEES